jgi:hypothetical protein
MKAVQLLLAIALCLIGATPSLSDSFAPRSFGYPVIRGSSVPGARVWLVRPREPTTPHEVTAAQRGCPAVAGVVRFR